MKKKTKAQPKIEPAAASTQPGMNMATLEAAFSALATAKTVAEVEAAREALLKDSSIPDDIKNAGCKALAGKQAAVSLDETAKAKGYESWQEFAKTLHCKAIYESKDRALKKLTYHHYIGYEPEKAKKRTEEEWFFDLLRMCRQDISLPYFLDKISKAAKSNNHEFFIRLGRELKRKPLQWPEGTPMDLAMVMLWANKGSEEYMNLSWFTDDALTQMLRIMTGNERLTLDAVRKTRQRLGLVQWTPPVVRRVERVGKDKIRFAK